MKLLAILVLVGCVCLVSAATKEELETRGKKVIERLDAQINRLKGIHPTTAGALEHQKKKLNSYLEQLTKGTPNSGFLTKVHLLIKAIEIQLSFLEKGGRPSPRPTAGPTEAPTEAPTETPTETSAA